MDSLGTFLRLTYTGISEGALLALIALGLVLVFKSSDVINFAHGEFMMMGAYVIFQLLLWFQPVIPTGFPEGAVVLLSLGVGILVLVAIAVVVERLVLRPLIGESVISVIMVTVGLSSIIRALVGAIWGAQPQRLPMTIIPRDFLDLTLPGMEQALRLPLNRLYTIGIVVLLVVVLIIFFRRSKEGVAMRATADDQQAAMSMGISIQRVFALTWSIAAVIAGMAGLLVANLINVSGDITGVGLRAFPVIILGGLDSILGAIVGGLIIGLVEQYASGYIDPSLKNVIPYIIVIVILMFRPYGLFGRKVIERV